MTNGGVLSVSLASADQRVTATVRDTGRGIAPADRLRLFEPFYTTRNNGTGLGLFSSRRILHEMNGSLEVEDATPGGAGFVLALPLA